jgi:polysaccharide deacetylase family protein (PEP-CTERM system associated)
MPEKNIFLFSIDLEDARENVADGPKYADRVETNTEVYLQWLSQHNFNCTFFVVGKVAEKYPELIKKIVSHGHEIACHSYSHAPVVQLGKEGFKPDLEKNINVLMKAGAKDIKGFRAPIFSLTKDSIWVYDILKEFGLTYSSSVLPAKNPLYGWEDFGDNFKTMPNGIVEFPMTLANFGPLKIPIAGGVYFRVLPNYFIFSSISKKFKKKEPVLSYFHPYDIDAGQEKYMHAGIKDNKFYNWLLYYNRKNVLNRLNKLLELNLEIMTYKKYLERL